MKQILDLARGRTEYYRDEQGQQRVRWIPERVVKGVAYPRKIWQV